MDRIKSIIDKYLHNSMPDNVQHFFAQWILNGDKTEQKDESLHAQWDELSENVKDHLTHHQRLQRLKAIHRIIGTKPQKTGIYISKGVFASIMLALLLVCSIPTVVYLNSERHKTCLLAPSVGKGEFTLPDGTHVWLNADSRLEYHDDFGEKQRCVVLTGEAFFDVSKSKTPFVVSMDDVSVLVLGTSFNARNSAVYGDYEVTLRKGRVEVALGDDKSLVLRPGQQLTVGRDLSTPCVEKVDVFNSTCWTEPSVNISDKPLNEVLTCLEHWHSVNFTIQDCVGLDKRISLKIKSETLVETLDVIKALVDIDYRIVDSENIIISDFNQ